MNTIKTSAIFLTIGGVLGFAAGITLMLFFNADAGDLEPTAPPGPTMKTLDEVEPRIPIPGSATPLASFVIDSPGSYYLAGDRNASGNAIEVNADNVTIDLMGYSLIGPDSGTNHGIYMNGCSNVEIRKGTVRDFGEYGIYMGAIGSENNRIIGVRAIHNGTGGIYLIGWGHLIKGCTASNNGHQAAGDVYGIYTDNGGVTVTGNTANWNGSYAGGNVHGIYASGEDNTVTDNTVCRNGHQANSVYGIRVGSGSIVRGNTANHNGFAASGNIYGIHATIGTTVTGNTACKNGNSATYSSAHGIYAMEGCTVIGNTVYDNGTDGQAMTYGIYLVDASLVDQNTAYYNHGVNMTTPPSATYGVNEY